ncbi:MAG: nucleotidyltransferase family protein [Candidatus Thermoplasmatota archaeon]
MKDSRSRGKSEVVKRLASSMGAIRKFGIRRIGLFGSTARGEVRQGSDVDILVEFEEGEEKFSNLMGLYFYLREILGRDVDLVTKGGMSSYLAPSILKEVEYIEDAS